MRTFDEIKWKYKIKQDIILLVYLPVCHSKLVSISSTELYV